jgi:hypothetical protein
MSTKPIIAIGMCSGGSNRVETTASLISNIVYLAQHGISAGLLIQIGGYVDVNRNVIIENAKKYGTTHLMFVDADMVFPEDGIMKLLKDDKDIVGGNYNARQDPISDYNLAPKGYQPMGGPTTKMLVDGQPVSMLAEDFPTELFKCYAVPTGFMMIKMKVFKKLEKPFFDAWIEKNGQYHTEDVDFCRKAQEAGFEVWCEPSFHIGHIGSSMY